MSIMKIVRWAGRFISGSGGLLLILFFFMPWVLVSCSGQELASFTGMELAGGFRMQGETVPGQPLLYILLAFGFLALLIALIPLDTRILGGAQMWVSFLALGMLIWFAISAKHGIRDEAPYLTLRFQAGYIGSVISAMMIGGGGTLMLIGGFEKQFQRWQRARAQAQPRADDLWQPPPPPPRHVASEPWLPPMPEDDLSLPRATQPPPDTMDDLAPVGEGEDWMEEKTLLGARPEIRLRFLEGPWKGKEIKVGGEQILVGRGKSCQVKIPDRYISRRHAVLQYKEGRWSIEDQESTGGTFVNGARVNRARLQPGDRVHIGKTIFEVYM